MVVIKRIYAPYGKDDGYRVLVDRLWPRSISKEKAHLDLWLKELAPSSELRQWFGHDPKKWGEFEKKYQKELSEKKAFIDQLKEIVKKYKKVTLLYGARDIEHNEAVILANLVK